jgi:predicted dinucleotide-binding enzyme
MNLYAQITLALALALGLIGLTASTLAQTSGATTKPAKIGVIGAGHIGGTLAELWVKAGHAVILSSRHPEELKPLAEKLGSLASVGSVQEAAEQGDVILISVPYAALPQIGKDYAEELKGKVVLETGNPYPQRDGEMASDARKRGTGVTSAEYLPGAKLVRAFNALRYQDLQSQSNRKGEKVAVPLAADDPDAMKVAAQLVRDAGFDPVEVGPLSRAKEFDVGSEVYVKVLTARELREKLHLPEPQK